MLCGTVLGVPNPPVLTYGLARWGPWLRLARLLLYLPVPRLASFSVVNAGASNSPLRVLVIAWNTHSQAESTVFSQQYKDCKTQIRQGKMVILYNPQALC